MLQCCGSLLELCSSQRGAKEESEHQERWLARQGRRKATKRARGHVCMHKGILRTKT